MSPPREGDCVMHEITPIALAGVFLGVGCAALFGYCVYVFASVCCRPACNKRRKN